MSNPSLKAPKGTRDLFGQEVKAFVRLEEVARRIFSLHYFSEVRTPIFEPVELFSRSLGSTSDVVEKEMFVFQDRGERTFALRPEGTASIVRHYIEHNLGSQGGTHQLYYVGPMFRGERPQAGRYRQFWQIGSEYFGSAEPSVDADTVLMAAQIFEEFGVKNFSIQVNSLGCLECRVHYRQSLLSYLESRKSELTEESQKRMAINPLRVLDSKIDGPKLTDAPVMKSFLCDACKKHHEVFLSLLSKQHYAWSENPRLVRGLDYYTRSVFEFVSPDLGAQSALAAGGRYDGLVESLGGPVTPGVGFALGMDRVVEAALKKGLEIKANSAQDKSAVVIPLGDEAVDLCFTLSQQLRAAGFSVAPVLARKKLKNQLSSASELGIRWGIMVGEDELKQNKVMLKDLLKREQLLINSDDIINKIQSLC